MATEAKVRTRQSDAPERACTRPHRTAPINAATSAAQPTDAASARTARSGAPGFLAARRSPADDQALAVEH
jgi:hypothetical protein